MTQAPAAAEGGESRVQDTALVGAAEAGRLLKAARQAQSLDLQTLSAAVKVAPHKLEALEAGRLEALPDLAFARALAKTVCRYVGVEAALVLEHLPVPLEHDVLSASVRGLNEPFRPMGMAKYLGWEWRGLPRTALWAPILLVLAAVLVLAWPDDVRLPSSVALTPPEQASTGGAQRVVSASQAPGGGDEDKAATPGGGGNQGSGGGEPTQRGGVSAQGASSVAASGAAWAAGTAASATSVGWVQGPLVLRTSAPAWVEVRDAQDQVLLSRLLMAGETVGVDGSVPMRVKIGNVEATQVIFKGQAQDLTPWRKTNVARLILQ